MNDMFLYYLILFSFVLLAGIFGIGIVILSSKYSDTKNKT